MVSKSSMVILRFPASAPTAASSGKYGAIGASIPGFDTAKMLADMGSPEVDNAVAFADQQAKAARVNSTPTFFAGTTGGTLQQINVGGLTADAFRPTLDALTR